MSLNPSTDIPIDSSSPFISFLSNEENSTNIFSNTFKFSLTIYSAEQLHTADSLWQETFTLAADSTDVF